jgi:acetoin utilization deacetylase AcuC-like enzyme
MLWKTSFSRFSELVLDSEIGALGFYEGLGFRPRRRYAYVLKAPRGYLLDSIAAMAESCPGLSPGVMEEICAHLKKTVRSLAALSHNGKDEYRKPSLRLVRRCLVSGSQPLLAQNAMAAVVRHRHRIPEAEELIGIGEQYGPLGDARQERSQAPSLTVVCDPRYAEHLKGVFHMESSRRIQAVEKALADPLLAGKWAAAAPRPASEKELEWVHGRSHIDRIAATAGKRLTSLDLDTQATERSYEAALLAVGGVFTVIDEIFSGSSRRGFAFIRPPGHHAEPDRAMGFCLFNNAAMAAQYLQRIYGLERLMIVDIDAHHGNGTQKAFYDTKEVLFLSLHEFPGFPGTGNFGEIGTGSGEGFTVNIPLPKGSRDRDFAQVVDALVRPVAEEYAPEALVVSCGFDLYQFDRLSGMNATPEGYAMMTRFLMEIAETVCAGRIVFILEGGYNLRGVEDCARATLLELTGRSSLAPEKIDRIRRLHPDRSSAIGKTIEVQKKYWISLRG